jgi:hypothetical protein
MNTIVEVDFAPPLATDGTIAAVNLTSARDRAWARFWQNPRRSGVAEEIVEKERLAAQFLGDLGALERLNAIATQFALTGYSFRAALIHAEVASTMHRFNEARGHLAAAAVMGGPSEPIERQSLTIDQACGVNLDAVLAARLRIANASGRLEDVAMLAAVLVDLERFAEADRAYHQSFYSYDDVSPFPLAWVCFQLGMLWGELALAPDAAVAALWYQKAITYLPGYVRARVHLAEILASEDRFRDAEALLRPVVASGDPEVHWRLADVLIAQEKFEEARTQLAAADAGFDELLTKHPLAFADHAAEFYSGSGNDKPRALALARANVANRPTHRARSQLSAIEASAGACALLTGEKQ